MKIHCCCYKSYIVSLLKLLILLSIGNSVFIFFHFDSVLLSLSSLIVIMLLIFLTQKDKIVRKKYTTEIEQKNKEYELLHEEFKKKQKESNRLVKKLDKRNRKLSDINIRMMLIEKRYKKLLDISPVGVFLIQKERIIYSNYKLLELLGYDDLNEGIGRPAIDFLHPDCHKIAIKRMEKMMQQTGTEVEFQEQKFIKKDGAIINAIVVSVSMIYMKKLTIQGYVLNITDRIKQEKELKLINCQLRAKQKQLIVARDKARSADKLKSAFLANMSHEIRTPMNAIIGFSSLLVQNKQSEEDRKYVEIINNSCSILLTLIDDIIDISKIDAGQLNIVKDTHLVNSIVKELYDKFNTTKNIVSFELDISDNSEKTVIYTDAVRLKQILSNLLSNAFKFTEKGSVKFGYEIKDKTIEFFVKDTGIGIGKDDVNIIFDRFRRTANSKAKIYGGTGIGLAIVKELVTLLGGSIRVISKPQIFTCFYINFPLQNIKTANAAITADNNTVNKEDTEYDWSKYNVLIAEDEEHNLLFLKKALTPTKISIMEARNGEEAIEFFSKNKPDLVLLDIKMPEKDGYEVIKTIKAQDKNVKVIAQTAYAMADDRDRIINAGFDDYIQKPISIDALKTVLKKHLQ